jgi:hypothetical protein
MKWPFSADIVPPYLVHGVVSIMALLFFAFNCRASLGRYILSTSLIILFWISYHLIKRHTLVQR